MAEERIERCFWCGKPKSGEIKETEETIKNSVINNYEPCDACKASFGNGIHVIGVTKEPIVKNMFPISKDDKNTLYPTGSMFVASEEFIKDMLSDESEKELLEAVLKEKVLMIPNELCEQIVNDVRNAQVESNGEYINQMDAVHEEGTSNEENVQD